MRQSTTLRLSLLFALGCPAQAATTIAPAPSVGAAEAVDCRAELGDLDRLQGHLRTRALDGPSAAASAELRVFAELDRMRADWAVACDAFRRGETSASTYAAATAEARVVLQRTRPAREELDAVVAAAGGETDQARWSRAFDTLREALLPQDVGGRVEVSVTLVRRGGGATGPLAQGAALYVGDQVRLEVDVRHAGFVYVFERSPGGELKALFPHRRISVRNPVPLGAVQLPPRGSYRVDDQLGPVSITVIASAEPLPALVTVLDLGLDASPEQVECLARGEPQSGGCQGDRGTVRAADSLPRESTWILEASPGQDRAVKVLSFDQRAP